MNLPYQAMLEQATDSVIYADQTGIIRFWNRASEILFGFSAEEAVGQSLDIIIPEYLREPHWRGFYAAIETGRTKHGGKPARIKALNKAGGYIYAEVGFCVVVDEETGRKGALSIARAAAPKG
ncbi:PAS domain-containing protein [Neisseria dentiae]|uniref:PAS domain-containing protein n=1 Tax=Neisseria dentiae TaxID=194197 RepID=UPI0035A1201E